MIKPKYSLKQDLFKINDEFVDRDEAKNIFSNKLHNNQKDYNILHYYGIGGIGKTSLKKEICKIHEKDNDSNIFFTLDLNIPEYRSLGSGILKLIDSCNSNINFRYFDIAYAIYFLKKNPGFVYKRDKKLITENPYIKLIFDIIGSAGAGFVGITSQIIERAFRGINGKMVDHDVKKELEKLDNMSILEIEDRLPLFLQCDLMNYLKNNPSSKILFVLDTFEALNENVIEPIHKIKNERWVQDLITYFDSKQFPNLLFVIFGRDKINWGVEWNDIIEQYRLSELDVSHSREYLIKSGINNDDIQNAIIKSSKGYPFYLYLSLNTYANIINSGAVPKISDFNGEYPEILEKFIYNLDKDCVELLKLLSIPKFYNIDIFKLFVTNFNVAFPISEFDQFNCFSFVTAIEHDNIFYINNFMKNIVYFKNSDDTINNVCKLLFKYYTDIVYNGCYSRDIIELFYYAKRCLSISSFNEWLFIKNNEFDLCPLDLLKQLQKNGEQYILIKILRDLTNDYSIDEISIEIVNIYIDIVHLGGGYKESVNICNTYLSHYDDGVIIEDKNLLKMSIRKIHHSMFFTPVNILIEQSLKLLNDISNTVFHDEYCELLFLLGGNLGVLSGKLDIASKYLIECDAYYNKNNLDSFSLRVKRKLLDIYLYDDKYLDIFNLIKGILNPVPNFDEVDNRYKVYLVCSLGEVYRKMGELDKAWNCYDIVDAKTTRNNLAGWQAHSYLGKGMLCIKKKDWVKAREFFERALNIYQSIDFQWGIINSRLAFIFLEQAEHNIIDNKQVIDIMELAKTMNYEYNIDICEKLLNNEIPYFQLFFL